MPLLVSHTPATLGGGAATVPEMLPAYFSTAMRFPLGYLVFMIPLPQSVVTPLIVELQLLVSTVGVRILQAAGVAVFREGNVLTLPGDTSGGTSISSNSTVAKPAERIAAPV